MTEQKEQKLVGKTWNLGSALKTILSAPGAKRTEEKVITFPIGGLGLRRLGAKSYLERVHQFAVLGVTQKGRR